MASPPSSGALDLSVIVITLNEQARLSACLASLPEGAEIIVVDSGSEDRTLEVAQRFAARVETRPFRDYADQKNAALDLATRSWVLSVDADEVLDDRLRQQVIEVCRGSAMKPSGYRLQRQLVFMGRRMRFGKTSDEPLRLFRREQGRFAAAIHEKLELRDGGPTGRLAGCIVHYSYDDLSDYFTRFNHYTTEIARQHRQRQKAMPSLVLHALRPWAEFFHRYVIRLGFLDGYAGYCYALVSSLYTFVKYAKLKELLDTEGKDRS